MATTSGQAKPLDQFERESEENRAALAATIDELRATVINEVTDFRRKISLQYLTSGVSGYARDTGSAWYAKVRDGARANPLRSVAIGAGLALPLAGVARRVPIPVLLIGAGVALARPSVKSVAGQAGDHLGRARSRLGDLAGAVADSTTDFKTIVSSRVSDVVGSTKAVADSGTAGAADGFAGIADAAAGMKSQVLDSGAALLRSGSEMMSDARSATARAASQTQTKATDIFHSNPLLVAGAGLAIGAFLAAILPTTEAESHLLEKTAPDLKRKASDLIDEGYETASNVVGKAVDGTIGRAKEQGLSVEGAQGAATSLSDKLGAVLEAVVGEHGPDDTGHNSAGEASTREHS